MLLLDNVSQQKCGFTDAFLLIGWAGLLLAKHEAGQKMRGMNLESAPPEHELNQAHNS